MTGSVAIDMIEQDLGKNWRSEITTRAAEKVITENPRALNHGHENQDKGENSV